MSEDIEIPQGAEFVEDENGDPYPYKMVDVARITGHHRVTILRLEQKNVIPKAHWRRLPQPHRVYSKADIEEIQRILDERGRDKPGREFIEEVTVTK